MEESESFGLHLPGMAKSYFVSIKGSGGTHFGLTAQEEARGIIGFRELQQ